MEVKLKLESYDRHEGYYGWHGLKVFGYQHATGEYRWTFPRRHVRKAFFEGIPRYYILEKYDIPVFDTLEKYFRKDAKEELEKELTELMKMSMNQRALLEMLFNEILIIGDQ